MRAQAVKRRFSLPDLGQGAQIIAFLLVVGLLVAMAIQPTRQLLQQRQRVSTMNQDLKHVSGVNTRLADRIERLQDPDYIEQRAREQIGLVRPGEKTYIVLPPGDAAKKKKPAAHKHVHKEEPAPEGGLQSFLHFLGVL
jgi:cell division protein FtsB